MQLRVPTEVFTRLRTSDVAELATHMDASIEVRGFITPNASFETMLQSLINHEHWFDAASLLAHALPPRSAVWWGALVCERRLALEDAGDSDIQLCLQVIEFTKHWVREPDEDTRLAIFRAVGLIPNSLPSYWAGMAAFWSTGNITPDAGIATQPPPFLYARAASAAVDMAAAFAAADREQVYTDALLSGMDIASGGSGEVKPAA